MSTSNGDERDLRPPRLTALLELPVPGDAAPANVPTDIGKLADRIEELAGAVLFFPGDIKASAASAPPAGWLRCDGQAVDRQVFAGLFAAIGTAYGAGDGATFNVPDLRDRFPAGAPSPAGLGLRGGAATVALRIEDMPSHNHGGDVWDPGHAHGTWTSDPGHAHSIATGDHSHWQFNLHPSGTGRVRLHDGGSYYDAPGVGTVGWSAGNLGGYTDARGVGTSVGIYGAGTGVQVYAQGGGWAHENRPPYLNLSFFIKT